MENSVSTSNSNEENFNNYLPKIKVLQIAQKNFARIGICPIVVSKPYAFDRKVLMITFLICSSAISDLMYIFHEAKSFSEYTRSIYMCFVCILETFIYGCTFLEAKKLFEIIEFGENFINTSE